jgi:hypothetical protein
MVRIKCECCRYFKARNQLRTGASDPPGKLMGRCRRYPPTPVRSIDHAKVEFHWPVVFKDDLCGEFVSMENSLSAVATPAVHARH